MNPAEAILSDLQNRLDREAIDQLRAEVARLAAENERLEADLEQARAQLATAEDWAESWRNDALDFQLQLCEAAGGKPGITQSGQLVVTQ